MDGFADRGDVIVIAASNRIEGLDPALLRPGRFDRQVLVSPPDLDGREAILKVHSRKMPVADVDLVMVARRTSGLTGADLANLCNEAAIHAGREGRDTIHQVDFDNALERVVAGMQTRRVMMPSEKRIIAYHEAGHAMVSEMLPSVPKVHKISIVPRGQALGYTLNLPEEDRYLMSKEDLLDYMKMLLGGYVTEQIVFERVTTGASDDLRRVAEISRSMIAQYGMGSKLLAHLEGVGENTSQATMEARDQEQQMLIDAALFETHVLVSENRELLDSIAQTLLEKESIERDELTQLVTGVSARPREENPFDVVVALPSIGRRPEQVFNEEFVPDTAEPMGAPRAHRDSVPPPKLPTSSRTTR